MANSWLLTDEQICEILLAWDEIGKDEGVRNWLKPLVIAGAKAQAKVMLADMEANIVPGVVERQFQNEFVAIPKQWLQQLKQEVERG